MGKRMKYRHSNVPSVLQGDVPEEEQRCIMCGESPCDFHHILNKTEKKFSEDYGLWVWLCRSHHSYIHDTGAGQKLWRQWKAKAQSEYEKTHTRQEWMRGAHRNYL